MRLELDFTTARLFVAVAEQGSIAGAARRENIAASAVSKRITEIERQAGVMLLSRSADGVALTQYGTKFLRRAQNILHESAALESELRDRGTVDCHIRIVANETALISFLPAIVDEFLRQNPRVTIDLDQRVAVDAIRAVEMQAADIGIFVGTAGFNDLDVRPSFRDRIVALVRYDHPLANSPAVKLDDLLAFEIIGHDRKVGLQNLERGAASAGKSLKIRLRVDSHGVVCRLVESGLGVGIISEGYARIFGNSSNLIALPVDEPWAERQHRVCTRKITSAMPQPCTQLLQQLIA